jgi:transcriptional regulator with XRE-family HTH domain
LREGVGLTQEGLADRLGVTQQAVAQAERWQSNPTVEMLRRWAAACGSTVEIALVAGTGRQTQQLGGSAIRSHRITCRRLTRS